LKRPTDTELLPPRETHEAARLGAEAFGTFFLTLTACAIDIVAVTHSEISHAERTAASGLVVLALIYAVSDVSGAHLNPAVTFAFALRGVFAWRRLPGYWLVQFAAAVVMARVTNRRVRSRSPRPAKICAALLAALQASEGRSHRRKRDRTPDRIGLSIKHMLLERAVAEDPETEAFEEWLLEQCLSETKGSGVGPTRAMALEILGSSGCRDNSSHSATGLPRAHLRPTPMTCRRPIYRADRAPPSAWRRSWHSPGRLLIWGRKLW
jgi:hypothetical protein